MHQLFEAQTLRTPDAIALTFAQERLTYSQLNSRANRLAHTLIAKGVTANSLVGVCLERSTNLIVAILAVLKAGGAYVPLDASYPTQRTAWMLEDTGATILLTSEPLHTRLRDLILSKTQVICLDTTTDVLDASRYYPDTDPRSPVSADNLAYVMYTSGSTGRPKGVMVPHRGIVRLVQNTDYVTFSPEDVFLQLAPVAFDAATFEIWGALLNGARLVLFPGEITSPRALGEYIQRQSITTLWLTAGLFHLMVEEEEVVKRLGGVRQMLAGGDVVSPHSARRFLMANPNSILINGYGPTENTTFTCCHRMTCVEEVESPVPIGRPIANTEVYVLDKNLHPVPAGVEGELFTGGEGLALGYWMQPELTAERFLPHPFDPCPDARLYRTGDRVRWRADGSLEFLGRKDQQVKIRGHRIELGEIEAALESLPHVRNAVVIARAITRGATAKKTDDGLVAYVIPVTMPTHDRQEWETQTRKALALQLPDVMLPARFVPMAAFPLTPNGKWDRQSLAEQPLEPQRVLRLHTDAVRSDRTEIETRLTTIWERVLQIHPIGASDDFFALGGHSLLAIRLLGAVEQELGVHLSLASVLNASTIRTMAALINDMLPFTTQSEVPRTNFESSKPAQWSSLVPLQAQGNRPPLFCAPAGGGSAFYYRALAARLAPDRPLYTFEPKGMSGTLPPHETIEEMASFYIQEMRRVRPRGPYYLAGLSFGGAISFEMAHQLTRSGEEVGSVLLFDSWAPAIFDRQTFEVTGPLPHIRCWLNAQRYALGLHFENLSVLETPTERSLYIRSKLTKILSKSAVWLRSSSALTNKELPDIYISQKRAEEEALRIYRPAPWQGKLYLIRARLQYPGFPRDPYLGWKGLASGGIETLESPGTHNSLLEEPCVRITASLVTRLLDCSDQSIPTEYYTRAA